MRREAAPSSSQSSARPPPVLPSHSPNASAAIEAPGVALQRALEMTRRSFFPSGLATHPAPSAVHPPSVSLPKTSYTMVTANAGSSGPYSEGVRGKESLSEPDAPQTCGSNVAASREDGAARDGTAAYAEGNRRDSSSCKRHQRRLRPLPYPSPIAAMSGRLIRSTSGAAVMTTESELDPMNGLIKVKHTNVTADSSWSSQKAMEEEEFREGDSGSTVVASEAAGRAAADGAVQPPRFIRVLASPTAATGSLSYLSTHTLAPSTATTRAGDQSASPDGVTGMASPFRCSVGHHSGVGLSAPANNGDSASVSGDTRHSDASSVFMPYTTCFGQSASSFDKSVVSTTPNSLATTSATNWTKGSFVTHVEAFPTHAVPYRACSRKFRPSVGRNADSHVYLNTNVMSYYEVAPSAATVAPDPSNAVPAGNEAPSANVTAPSAKAEPSPISSSMAGVASAADAYAPVDSCLRVHYSPSAHEIKRTGAVKTSANGAGISGVAGTVHAPAPHLCTSSSAGAPTPPLQQCPSFAAVDTDSTGAATVPMSGKNSAGDGRLEWGPLDARNSSGRVVRVVKGLLRSPALDELGVAQLSESSLHSPPSCVGFAPGASVGPSGSGGAAAQKCPGGSGVVGAAGSSVGAYRASNPISALLTGARPRVHVHGSPQQPQQPYRAAGFHRGGAPYDIGAGGLTNEDHSSGRNALQPSSQGDWGGSRDHRTAHTATTANQHSHSGSVRGEGNANIPESMPCNVEGGPSIHAHAGTCVAPPPTSTRMHHLSNASMPASRTPQRHQPPLPTGRSSSAPPTPSGSEVPLNSAVTSTTGRTPPPPGPVPSTSTLKLEGGGSGEARQDATATSAAVAASQRQPSQRMLSSLKDVLMAASLRSISSVLAAGASTSSPPPPPPLHQRVQNAAATAVKGQSSDTGGGPCVPPLPTSPPLPQPLPPTFALFGVLERLSRFSELAQLHQEHTRVVDDFLSRLTLELHRTALMSTCGANSFGGGGGGGNCDLHDDREFLRWHRILKYLFRNPSELMKVGVEFFSDAVNSWPLHVLYLTCCFHVTACEHGFAALSAALRTGGIVSSGKGLFAALAVAMADGEEGFIRSTACMYRAAFYTGVLMRKRHQMFESETRLTMSGGFTLLVVNIPIMTLRRLVAKVNAGYDVFVPMKTEGEDKGGGDNNMNSSTTATIAGRRSATGQPITSPGSSLTTPSTQAHPFQPHSVIEISRVISSRSAVLCGHPLDLLRLDMILARFADFNGVKIHKEYLPAGGPENSNFFNKRMPHELLGLWRARGVSFSLSSVRLPVYSPINGDLWAESALAAPTTTWDRAGGEVNGAASPLASPSISGHHDELFMFLVAEAATAANQDLTYSLRHMRDGSVLLDFSTHAISIGRLIAWTNKSITVLAAPENRQESSAMPPPRRSPKDSAVLDTMEKLAIINDVLREVSESLEQPPDALAHPRVDLFTTFTDLGLLVVTRGAAAGGESDAALESSGSNGRALNSGPGPPQMLSPPACACADHQSGGSGGGGAADGRGGWITGSSLANGTVTPGRVDLSGSPCYSPPAHAAGRRMKPNTASFAPTKGPPANPSHATGTGSASLGIATNSASLNGHVSGVPLCAHSMPLTAAPVVQSNPSFSAASMAASLSVRFNSPPPPPPLHPLAGSTTARREQVAATAGGAPALLSPSGAREVLSGELSVSGFGGGSGGALTTPQNSSSGTAGQGMLSMGSYPECHGSPARNVLAIAGGSLNGAAAVFPGGVLALSPTPALACRELRRSNTGGDVAGGLAANTTATTTGASAAFMGKSTTGPPTGHLDASNKTVLRESDVLDYRSPLRLRRLSSHQQTLLLSSSSSSSHPARSRTYDNGQQHPFQQQQGMLDPSTAALIQQSAQQSESKGSTPTSPNVLWHTVSPVNQIDFPVRAGITAALPLPNPATEMPGADAPALACFFLASHDRPPLQLQQQQRLHPPPLSQLQRPHLSCAPPAAFLEHHPLSLPSMRSSLNNSTTTMRSPRGSHYAADAVEPGASVRGDNGSGASPRPRRMLDQAEPSPLSVREKDFVIRRNHDYAGIVNVYQVSPLITYYEMQFNCVLCDGAVLFAERLRKTSGIAFPPYTLLLCPSVFSLLELWDGFEFEELWRRSMGATLVSRVVSPLCAGPQ